MRKRTIPELIFWVNILGITLIFLITFFIKFFLYDLLYSLGDVLMILLYAFNFPMILLVLLTANIFSFKNINLLFLVIILTIPVNALVWAGIAKLVIKWRKKKELPDIDKTENKK